MKMINSKTANRHHYRKEKDDPLVLKTLDMLFRSKRGHVIEMPPKGEPVMACLSGGIDSVVNILMLLEEGYRVYAFWVDRGQSNREWELKAINWYDRYFKTHYKELYKECFHINLKVPSKSYKHLLRATKHLQDDLALRRFITYPSRNPIMFLAGMEYAYSLESKGIKVRNLFVAEHEDDNSVHGTLTLMRITNLMMCYLLQDWDFQFISIPIEREFGNFYGKDRLVKYADKMGMPLEHTRTCCDASEIQCGVCDMACFDRRMGFKNAKVKDKTKYLNPMPKSVDETRKDTSKNWAGKK